MKKVSKQQEAQNFVELHEFRKHWRNSKSPDSRGSVFRISASITYNVQQLAIDGKTVVNIETNGIEDGDVYLDDVASFPAESFHMRFSAAFQTYTFHKNNGKLTIAGNSDKMRGAFSVEIDPSNGF